MPTSDLKVNIKANADFSSIKEYNKAIKDQKDLIIELRNKYGDLHPAVQKANQTLQQFNNSLNDHKQHLNSLTTHTSGASNGFTKLSQSVNGISGQLNQLGSHITGLITGFVGLAAISKSFDFIKDVTMTAARTETLGVVVNQVGKVAGYSSSEIERYVDGIKKMGITTQVARDSVVKFIQANLDLKESSALSRIAQDAAVIGGTNSSEALQGIIHGITTQQVEVLRTYGIVVSLENELSKYAKANGVATTSIDAHTKQQIMLNAVLREGQKIQGTYEASMTTAWKQMSSLARYAEEAANKLGEGFLPVMKDVVGVVKDVLTNEGLIKFFSNLFTVIGEGVMKIFEFAKNFGNAISVIMGGKDGFDSIGKSLTNLVSGGFDMLLYVFEQLKQPVLDLIQSLKNLFGDNPEILKTVIGLVINVGLEFVKFQYILINGVIKAITWLYEAFKTVYDYITTSKVFEYLSTSIQFVILIISEIISMLWNNFISALKAVVGVLVGVFKSAWDLILPVIKTVAEWVEKLWNWFKDTSFAKGIVSAFDSVIDAIKTLVGWMKDAYDWAKKLINAKNNEDKDPNPLSFYERMLKTTKELNEKYQYKYKDSDSTAPERPRNNEETKQQQKSSKGGSNKNTDKTENPITKLIEDIQFALEYDKEFHNLTMDNIKEFEKLLEVERDSTDNLKDKLRLQKMFNSVEKERWERLKFDKDKVWKSDLDVSDETIRTAPERGFKQYEGGTKKDYWKDVQEKGLTFASSIGSAFSSLQSAFHLQNNKIFSSLINNVNQVLNVIQSIKAVMDAIQTAKTFLSFLGSALSGGAQMAFAGGGYVTGSGTSTSDSIMARLSNGEFVVNANSTAKYLPLLQSLNNGDNYISSILGKFSTGGSVRGYSNSNVRLEVADVKLRGSDLFLSWRRQNRLESSRMG